jgi:SecD/SecF fusion protein
MKQNKKKLIKNLVFVVAILLVVGSLFTPILKNIKFGLDLQGGFEVLYQVQSIDGSKVTKDMVTSTYKTIERRINVLGVSEPSIIVEGNDKIRVQLAGITNPEEARMILSQAANLTFRDTSDNLLMNSDVLKSGGARVGQDDRGYPAVALSVKDKDKFFDVTKSVSQKNDNRIVIWLDYEETDSFAKEEINCGSLSASKCLSVAAVSQGFASDVIIQGNFSLEEVKNIVELINSGSLPTKLDEISSKTVDASFGADSLNKTFTAGVVGISLIMIFMIAIYKFSGFIASVGLFIYTFLIFLIFWLVGGVLTLPGIAAVVIGIGMAVDSSVISFARIKDELLGKSRLATAFINGNKNSFMTILDSNITTLLVAIILFIFGESSVKGFATMLIISIVVTMLVMVLITRVLLKLFVKSGYFDNKLNAFIGFKETNKVETKKSKIISTQYSKIDFVKPAKWFYLLSGSLIVIGMAFVILFGLNLGIDFKGGSSITLKTDTTVSKEQLKNDIELLELNYYEIETLDNKTSIIKVTDTLDKDLVLKTEKYFSDKYQAETDIGVVSNVVKEELTKNAIFSLIIASIGIVIYISIRFRFSYALGAIVSLLHDVFIIVALFSVLRLEINSIFIAALLSIIGYSINDTIVTFDRIRENIRTMYKDKINSKDELVDVVNTSLRQTLTRSIITTVTTLIPVVALIVLGSHEIINFNIALLFGLLSGVYSSIFIASQIWLEIEKKNIGKPIKKKWYEEDEKEVEELKIKGINS